VTHDEPAMAAHTQRTVRTPDGRTLAIEDGANPIGEVHVWLAEHQ